MRRGEEKWKSESSPPASIPHIFLGETLCRYDSSLCYYIIKGFGQEKHKQFSFPVSESGLDKATCIKDKKNEVAKEEV